MYQDKFEIEEESLHFQSSFDIPKTETITEKEGNKEEETSVSNSC